MSETFELGFAWQTTTHDRGDIDCGGCECVTLISINNKRRFVDFPIPCPYCRKGLIHYTHTSFEYNSYTDYYKCDNCDFENDIWCDFLKLKVDQDWFWGGVRK